MPPRFALSVLNPRSLSARSFGIPGLGSNAEEVNREAAQAVEMPGFNGMGNARAVAKLYGSVATGGSELGMTAATLDALMKARYSANGRLTRQGIACRHGILAWLR